jgi:hypothetical protein
LQAKANSSPDRAESILPAFGNEAALDHHDFALKAYLALSNVTLTAVFVALPSSCGKAAAAGKAIGAASCCHRQPHPATAWS